MRLPVLTPDAFRPARTRLSPEFLAALGACMASFGDLEDALLKLSWRLMSGGRETFRAQEAAEAQKLSDRFRKASLGTLGTRIAMFREAIFERWGAEQPEMATLLTDLDRVHRLRNMLAHSSWRVTGDEGCYAAIFIDRDRQAVEHCLSAADLRSECQGVETLLLRLFEALAARDPALLDPQDHEALPGRTNPRA